jgi:predicted CoA-binding protein
MTDFARILTEPETSIAVIGASDNPAKYGAIIYRDLKARGLRVLAVNPRRATVDGDPCYSNLAALPEPPTLIDMVVPPEVGRGVLEEAEALGYKRVWFQPGSESAALIEFARSHEFEFIYDACIMVVAGQMGRTRRRVG